ncbi:MAG: isoprenylcysteine carboxylmethyltransferase family protein [Planctomycetes bacterium]|nr:isoprenylcysteine carboxylmethyltransferase family protein [Planctomycetota bacterium]
MLSIVLQVALFAFPVSELVLAFVRRGSHGAQVDDRGSMRLVWIVILASSAIAVVLSSWPPGRLPISATARQATATALLLAGLVLRWTAILTLGRFFTVDVAVHEGHRVVRAGPYRFVRHPSYTGLLVALLGLGVFYGSWAGLLVLMLPITLALRRRILVEEDVLARALGAEYTEYCAHTKRLLPGVW